MADVEFEDNRVVIKRQIADCVEKELLECCAEIISAVTRNTRVDTGKTKGSWKAYVRKTSTGYAGYTGSDEENAIWEEFGTGEYALQGNGRKGGWTYKSDKDGKFYRTHGKKPTRAFWNAYVSLKSAIINRLQNALKGL